MEDTSGALEDEDVARAVVDSLQTYLEQRLPIIDLLPVLQQDGILNQEFVKRLSADAKNKGASKEICAAFLDHARTYFTTEFLLKFCDTLDKESKSCKPALAKIARKIRSSIALHKGETDCELSEFALYFLSSTIDTLYYVA